MMHPHVSIVVPAYNEATELPATLAAIREATAGMSPSIELIVVDNNSTDATAETARSLGADKVVFEAENQIARARNAGGRAASGDYIVFVDADTRISKALFDATLKALENGACGGGSLIDFEASKVSGLGRFGIGLWKKISRRFKLAAGSYVFCRREGFAATGGFDTRLYAGEEVRFSQRLKAWGRRNGMRFEVLTDHPAKTSARKLDWYSDTQIIGHVLLTLFLMPLVVRSRRLCRFWYRRPGTA